MIEVQWISAELDADRIARPGCGVDLGAYERHEASVQPDRATLGKISRRRPLQGEEARGQRAPGRRTLVRAVSSANGGATSAGAGQ